MKFKNKCLNIVKSLTKGMHISYGYIVVLLFIILLMYKLGIIIDFSVCYEINLCNFLQG